MAKIALLLLVVFAIFSVWFLISPIPHTNINSRKSAPSLSPASSSTPSANISVDSPVSEQNLSSPFEVKGKARVFENVVSIRLTSKSGKILESTTAYAKSEDAGTFGNFDKEIFFKTDESGGTLEVFQLSPKDGSEVDKVSIPVLLK